MGNYVLLALIQDLVELGCYVLHVNITNYFSEMFANGCITLIGLVINYWIKDLESNLWNFISWKTKALIIGIISFGAIISALYNIFISPKILLIHSHILVVALTSFTIFCIVFIIFYYGQKKEKLI